MKNGSCGCPCHMFSGLVITAVGAAFLLKHYGVITNDTMNILWPIAIIVIGLKRAFGHKCKCCDKSKCCNQ